MSFFIGKNYFKEDAAQNYLVFQPIIRYFKVNTINNVTNYVLSWKSKGLSDEVIKPYATSNNSLTPEISCFYASKIRVKFTGSCLKQDEVIFNHGKVVNIYIVYELGASSSSYSDPTLKNCLFGAVTLTKRFWNCIKPIMFRKYFKRLISRWYEKNWIYLSCLWFYVGY